MKLTPTARAVLEAAEKRQDNSAYDSGIGANYIADLLELDCGHIAPLRAGQYAGRLVAEGWLRRRSCWHRGRRGHDVYTHTEYFITAKGRKILLDRPNRAGIAS